MQHTLTDDQRLELRLRTLEFKIERLRQRLDTHIVINTPAGKMQGAERRSVYDRVYYSFEGIPYAQPPVGELRFRAPRPMQPWLGVRDCTDYAAKPCQRLPDGTVGGSENCLYLNIYTNNMKPLKIRPVIVFIYGEQFVRGEATPECLGPDYFMRKDIILVTIQYRVGALGFLSLSDPQLHTPGNAAIKDQILALKWIIRNIGAFGGDAKSITVIGHRAGAMCTQLLMISEEARGLFQRAILQSGYLTCDWNYNCATSAYKVAHALGYTGKRHDERQILKYLQNCRAQQIVEAETDVHDVRIPFGICVEPYVTQHTVMARQPSELLAQAWGNSIPLIVGNNSNEGSMYSKLVLHNPEHFLRTLDTCTQYVPLDACGNRDSPECLSKGLKLRALHVKTAIPTVEDFFEMISYSSFWHPLLKTVDARLQRGPKAAATYLYRYDFATTTLASTSNYSRGYPSGSAHVDELSTVFHNVHAKRMEPRSLEYKTIKRMIALWTTFATTGNPNMSTIIGKSKKHVKWHPLRKVSRQATAWQCMNISDELAFIDLPEMAKLRAWNGLYDDEQHQQSLTKHTNALELPNFAHSNL